MSYQKIAKIIPTIQAVGLVSHNIKKVNKKKVRTKEIVDLGITNIVGTNLIKINADIISEI